MSAAVRRVQEALDAHGLGIRVVEVARSARSAEEAADAVGAEVGAIVKSLVFLAAGAPVLAMVSGADRLDPARLGAVAGEPVRRADADAVRAATGYPIGGVSPVALPRGVPVYCDRALLAFPVVWAAAGTPHAVFPVPPADLVRVTGATVADLAVR